MLKPSTDDMTKSIRDLDRDKRGYPIPFIVFRDKQGNPVFTINDTYKVVLCRRMALCSVCGKRLHPWGPRTTDREMWFVGGSRAFLCDGGVFRDPPVHYPCGRYALKVCPFLAAPSYGKSIAKQKAETLPFGTILEPAVLFSGPIQPEWFAIGLARLAYFSEDKQTYYVPTFYQVEFWRNGEHVNAPASHDVKRLVNL